MALQLVRGQDMRDMQEDFASQLNQAVKQSARANAAAFRKSLLDAGKDASEEAVAREIEKTIEGFDKHPWQMSQNASVEVVLDGAYSHAPIFLAHRWTVVRSRTPFLTSDRPVVLIEHKEPGWRGVGLATADMIVFTLNRHAALILTKESTRIPGAVVDLSDNYVQSLNLAIANHARRWVFHHPKDEPLKGLPYSANPTQPL